MDFTEVESQLNDLPAPFKRNDATYQQVIDSLSTAMYLLTQGTDGIISQLTFQAATDGWLDLWGLLLGIPRQLNEADVTYANRINVTITGGAGPVQVMLDWISAAWNINVVIQENLPALGYLLIFPGTISTLQINQIVAGLAQVRPAGVPFTGAITNIGTYLDTVNYFDASKVTGSYLGGGATPITLTPAVSTNNSPPLVPELLITDPTLNPGLTA